MVSERKVIPDNVDHQARVLVETLHTGSGWRKEHGRMQRVLIIRDDAAELESA